MPLSKPVPHVLVEGTIGEVIPAELLQRCADFADSTVGTMARDHARDARGYHRHVGSQFAVAGACFELPAWSRDDKDDPSGELKGGRVLWAFGMKDPPRLVRRERYNSTGNIMHHDYFVEWSLPRQLATLGEMIGANADGDIWAGSAGTFAGTVLAVSDRDDKRSCFVGGSWFDHWGEVERQEFKVSSAIKNIRAIFIWAHQ